MLYILFRFVIVYQANKTFYFIITKTSIRIFHWFHINFTTPAHIWWCISNHMTSIWNKLELFTLLGGTFIAHFKCSSIYLTSKRCVLKWSSSPFSRYIVLMIQRPSYFYPNLRVFCCCNTNAFTSFLLFCKLWDFSVGEWFVGESFSKEKQFGINWRLWIIEKICGMSCTWPTFVVFLDI